VREAEIADRSTLYIGRAFSYASVKQASADAAALSRSALAQRRSAGIVMFSLGDRRHRLRARGSPELSRMEDFYLPEDLIDNVALRFELGIKELAQTSQALLLQ
jgi:hypothetical protein